MSDYLNRLDAEQFSKLLEGTPFLAVYEHIIPGTRCVPPCINSISTRSNFKSHLKRKHSDLFAEKAK